MSIHPNRLKKMAGNVKLHTRPDSTLPRQPKKVKIATNKPCVLRLV